MKYHIAAASLMALFLPGCADASNGESAPITEDPARACIVLLAEGTAYVEQHTANREEKLKVIRFASEADMDAYNELTDTFTMRGIELTAMHKAIETERGLPEHTETYIFEDTTDQGAEARIEFANDCALKLLE